MLDMIEMEGVPIWGHIIAIDRGHNIIHGQNQHQIKKKNDRLYQRFTYNHIHWPNGLWKNSPCFRLD